MKLTEASAGSRVVVTRIDADAQLANRITAIGITKGVPMQVVRNDRKMPVMIHCRETLIAINRRDAEKIEVKAS